MHSDGKMERNAIGFPVKWRITHGEDKAKLIFNQNELKGQTGSILVKIFKTEKTIETQSVRPIEVCGKV